MLQRKHRCGFIGASSTDVLTFSLPLNHRLTWRGGRQGLGFLECVSHLKGSIKTTPLILDELVPVSASDLKFGKGKGLSRGLWLFKLPYWCLCHIWAASQYDSLTCFSGCVWLCLWLLWWSVLRNTINARRGKRVSSVLLLARQCGVEI